MMVKSRINGTEIIAHVVAIPFVIAFGVAMAWVMSWVVMGPVWLPQAIVEAAGWPYFKSFLVLNGVALLCCFIVAVFWEVVGDQRMDRVLWSGLLQILLLFLTYSGLTQGFF